MSGLEARIAAVLQDHVPEPVHTSAEEGYMACYGCDWRGASYAGVYAHQAAMLAPVIREAQAEAWREGYIKSCFDHGDGGKLHGADNINPYRADNLEAS